MFPLFPETARDWKTVLVLLPWREKKPMNIVIWAFHVIHQSEAWNKLYQPA